MSSGLTARRLILQQLIAVAEHSPFKAALALVTSTHRTNYTYYNNTTNTTSNNLKKCSDFCSRVKCFFIRPENSRGAFTLMTEEEIKYLQRRREENGDESRVILSTRPTRRFFKGLAGSALNVILSFFISPFLALSVSLEAVRLNGARPTTLVIAPVVGLTWGAVFACTALYAALQQFCLCLFYQLQTPVVYLFISGRCWNELACRYEYPSGICGSAHPLLAQHPSQEKLLERAMRRESQRQRRTKRQATYKSLRNGKATGEDDYYTILGVERNATAKQIKEAYNRLVLELHPDKNPSKTAATEFDAITKAYRVLGNAEKRRKYDIGGANGVENIGEKKRDGVRALFGGDALHAIVGDVKTGSFSQRVVDGLDWTEEELAVCLQRMRERCRDELLTLYLQPLQDCNIRCVDKNITANHKGLADVKRRLQQFLNTGLAREVLYAVGQEYMRVVLYVEANGPLQRLLLYIFDVAPHRLRRRLDKWGCLSRIRQHTFKDSAAMVDLAWYTSVEELEYTARWVASAVLMDPLVPRDERHRRRDALRTLAETFITYGHVYKGANKQTMDTLMNSLRAYKESQQRKGNDE